MSCAHTEGGKDFAEPLAKPSHTDTELEPCVKLDIIINYRDRGLLSILRNSAFKALEENIGDAFPVLWCGKTFKAKYKI